MKKRIDIKNWSSIREIKQLKNSGWAILENSSGYTLSELFNLKEFPINQSLNDVDMSDLKEYTWNPQESAWVHQPFWEFFDGVPDGYSKSYHEIRKEAFEKERRNRLSKLQSIQKNSKPLSGYIIFEN